MLKSKHSLYTQVSNCYTKKNEKYIILCITVNIVGTFKTNSLNFFTGLYIIFGMLQFSVTKNCDNNNNSNKQTFW